MSASEPGSKRQRPAAAWLANAQPVLAVPYFLAVILLLVCYFLKLPVDRREFYRQTLVAWKAFAVSLIRPSGATRATIPPGQQIVGYLDQVQGQSVVSGSATGEINVSGWAACAETPSKVVKVEVLVDSQARANAELSLPRPDVGAAYGRDDFDNSGWRSSFPARSVGFGAHELSARVTCASGATSRLPAFRLLVSGNP
jgi:hypothetical protein